jgi:hypothetical protein
MSRVMLVASRLRQNSAVAPQPIIGQVGAAPPTVDRIVAAEVLLMGQDGPPELRQRQSAAEMYGVPIPVILTVDRA